MQQTASQPAGAPVHPASAIGYNMAGIAALVLLMAVGVGHGIDQLARQNQGPQPALADGNRITQTIGGKELSIPARWFRFGEQMRDGFTNQIDLQVRFAPEGASEALPVDVTLLPRSRVRTSASLLDAVYLHQFGDGSLSGVTGLVGKPMQGSNGYTGESIWYDAISPNPFVAKCADGVSERPAQCVRTVYLPSGIAAVYTFDAATLQSWRQFDAGMQQWLAKIGAW